MWMRLRLPPSSGAADASARSKSFIWLVLRALAPRPRAQSPIRPAARRSFAGWVAQGRRSRTRKYRQYGLRPSSYASAAYERTLLKAMAVGPAARETEEGRCSAYGIVRQPGLNAGRDRLERAVARAVSWRGFRPGACAALASTPPSTISSGKRRAWRRVMGRRSERNVTRQRHRETGPAGERPGRAHGPGSRG